MAAFDDAASLDATFCSPCRRLEPEGRELSLLPPSPPPPPPPPLPPPPPPLPPPLVSLSPLALSSQQASLQPSTSIYSDWSSPSLLLQVPSTLPPACPMELSAKARICMVLTAACFFKGDHYLFREIGYATNPFLEPTPQPPPPPVPLPPRFSPYRPRRRPRSAGIWRFSHPHKYGHLTPPEKNQVNISHWRHGLRFQSSRREIGALEQYEVPFVVKKQWRTARGSVRGPPLVAYQSDGVRRLLDLIEVPGVDLRFFGAPLVEAESRRGSDDDDGCHLGHDFDRPCQVEVAKRLVAWIWS